MHINQFNDQPALRPVALSGLPEAALSGLSRSARHHHHQTKRRRAAGDESAHNRSKTCQPGTTRGAH